METALTIRLNDRYKLFMNEVDIKDNGILSKISNPRYKAEKLRFSGMPYIGSKYEIANKKILFVGLDIGIDERRKEDTYHDFPSRRICIAGTIDGCDSLDYNDHISGTYSTALYLLQKYYSWEDAWNKLVSRNDITNKTAINNLKNCLPIEVLDYVSLTNIHKFVTLCRGCDPVKERPNCWKEECLEERKSKNRTGNDNRKWYNKNEEIKMLLEEIKILAPDLVYFQGSAAKLDDSVIKEINSICDICIEYHPSSWKFGANKAGYAKNIKIREKVNY
jgi:hypothetical protein